METWERQSLLEAHEYVLISCGGDTARFLTHFRGTWKVLPATVQSVICEYWRAQGRPPLIELSDVWSPKTMYGQVRVSGMELRFRADSFKHLPTPAANWIIAHELAHVYQKASGRVAGGDNESENEEHANKLAKSWGFDDGVVYLVEFVEAAHKLTFAEACKRVEQLRF